ncbi:MAG: hypothetical protein ACWA5L_03955 [bacterium]
MSRIIYCLLLLIWPAQALAQLPARFSPNSTYEVNLQIKADQLPVVRPGLLLEEGVAQRVFLGGQENFVLIVEARRLLKAGKSSSQINRDAQKLELTFTFRIDMNMNEEPLFIDKVIVQDQQPVTNIINVDGYNLYTAPQGPVHNLAFTISARPLDHRPVERPQTQS